MKNRRKLWNKSGKFKLKIILSLVIIASIGLLILNEIYIGNINNYLYKGNNYKGIIDYDVYNNNYYISELSELGSYKVINTYNELDNFIREYSWVNNSLKYYDREFFEKQSLILLKENILYGIFDVREDKGNLNIKVDNYKSVGYRAPDMYFIISMSKNVNSINIIDSEDISGNISTLNYAIRFISILVIIICVISLIISQFKIEMSGAKVVGIVIGIILILIIGYLSIIIYQNSQ